MKFALAVPEHVRREGELGQARVGQVDAGAVEQRFRVGAARRLEVEVAVVCAAAVGTAGGSRV